MLNQIYLDKKQLEKVQEYEEKNDIRYEKQEKSNYTEGENIVNDNKYNKKVFGAGTDKYFCVFRVGKKIKDISQVQALEKHMERQIEVFNADPKNRDKNRILVGDKNITENVKNYIYGIKLRENANICRDLVLTSNNDFFKTLSKEKQELWIQENIKFLKENFGDNCVYACLHLDE